MRSVKILLKTCLALKSGESMLVLTDNTGDRRHIAEEIYRQAKRITRNVRYMHIPEPTANGSEPGSNTAKEMQTYDVIAILTAKSLSHTMARKQATDIGARIASMPGITRKAMSAVSVNYRKMQELTAKIADRLDRANKVQVLTKLGTNIEFSVRGRKAHGRKAGIFDKPGYWGNLPDGEAFIAPLEGTGNGIYAVDASHAGIGRLEKPIWIKVRDGAAYEIDNPQLHKMLESAGSRAFNIAEFGIGTNRKARVSGLVLEDEKVLGTCHIALGNNMGFGGRNDVEMHVDGVITKPTIILDHSVIMDRGKLKI